MSEPQSNVRLRLGPVATALIADHTENRQQALDAAIEELQSQERSTSCSGTTPDQSVASELAELRESVEVLKQVVVLEQKLTRIYIASFMEDSEGAQEQLLKLAQKAINEVVSQKGFLKERDLKEILEEEDYRRELLAQSTQRTAPEQVKQHEPELER